MALTANTKISERQDSYYERPVAAGTTTFIGSMLAFNSAGLFVLAGNAAAVTPAVGRCADAVVGNGTLTARAYPGRYFLTNSAGAGNALTVADIGRFCYAVDDNVVHRVSGSRQVMGMVCGVDATLGVEVDVDPKLSAAAFAVLQGTDTPIIHVRGASTADVPNLAAFAVANDGIALVAGDRVLLKNQNAGAENGIYVCGTVVGGVTCPLTRATDADGNSELVPNCLVAVSEGTAGLDTLWQLTTNAPITVGATALTFTAAPLSFGLVGAMTAETPDVAANAGVAATAARIDHVHAITCAAPLAAGVVCGSAAAEGAAVTFARSDHTHEVLSNVAPTNIAPDDAAAAGAAGTFSNSGHVHGITCAAPPVTAAGMGVAAAPAEGAAASFARSDHTHALGLPAVAGEGQPFYIYHTFTAGAGGADDVTVYNADCPYALRILDCGISVSTAGAGGSTLTARDAAGGAGNALSSALATQPTGVARTALTTAMAQVAAGGSLYLRRTDNTCVGEFWALCMRTA